MPKFTTFCQEKDAGGTTHIQSLEADSAEHAKVEGRRLCAEDWMCEVEDVTCVGVAEGEVNILFWKDPWE